MNILVLSKTDFTIVEYKNAKSVAFASNTYTITDSTNSTQTYNANYYIVRIIN